MSDRVQRKTIERAESLNCSVNGNPRFLVHFTDGTSAVTMSDAAVNYDIDNLARLGDELEVTFTRAGRVSYARPVSA